MAQATGVFMAGVGDKRVRTVSGADADGGAQPSEVADAGAAHMPGPESSGRFKIRMTLRPLDTGKPEEYESWRFALKAEMVGAGPPAAKMVKFMSVIDDPARYPADRLQAEIAADTEIAAVDAKLFSLILSSLSGSRRTAAEERIRGQVPFAAGALALRCLDAMFQQSESRRRFAATQELMGMQPAGRSVAAYDRFFTRYRLLLQQAGPSHVGAFAQINILRRAVEGNPRLQIVWAAWREADGMDPDALLTRLEEAVYEGLHAGGSSRQGDAAWTAVASGSEWVPIDEPRQGDAEMPGWGKPAAEFAANAAQEKKQGGKGAGGKGAGDRRDIECWHCGNAGHRKAECPQRPQGNQARQGDVLQKLDELIKLLKESGISKNC